MTKDCEVFFRKRLFKTVLTSLLHMKFEIYSEEK